MIANEVPAPPAGFRKAIPCGAKLASVIRQEGRCKACGEHLGDVGQTQFDHVPALGLRGWDPEAEDTLPPANDPEAIHAKHKDCHLAKTTGRKGESKLNAIHGDVAEIAKLRRLTRKQQEFRDRLLAKDQGEAPEGQEKTKKKTRWPKRSFNNGARRETATTRSDTRSRGFGRQRGDRGLLFRDDIETGSASLPVSGEVVPGVRLEDAEN